MIAASRPIPAMTTKRVVVERVARDPHHVDRPVLPAEHGVHGQVARQRDVEVSRQQVSRTGRDDAHGYPGTGHLAAHHADRTVAARQPRRRPRRPPPRPAPSSHRRRRRVVSNHSGSSHPAARAAAPTRALKLSGSSIFTGLRTTASTRWSSGKRPRGAPGPAAPRRTAETEQRRQGQRRRRHQAANRPGRRSDSGRPRKHAVQPRPAGPSRARARQPPAQPRRRTLCVVSTISTPTSAAIALGVTRGERVAADLVRDVGPPSL